MWIARNKLLREGQHSTTTDTMNLIKHYLREVYGGRDKSVVCRVPIVSWKFPQEGFIKIKFDVGFFEQNKKYCLGIIIRDDFDTVLCSKTIMHANIPSRFAAKVMACFQAAETGLQLGFSSVEIEGDSLVVI